MCRGKWQVLFIGQGIERPKARRTNPLSPIFASKLQRFGHWGLWRLCLRRLFFRLKSSPCLFYAGELVSSGGGLIPAAWNRQTFFSSWMASSNILDGGLIPAEMELAQSFMYGREFVSYGRLDMSRLDGTRPCYWLQFWRAYTFWKARHVPPSRARQLSLVLLKHLRRFVHSRRLDMSHLLEPAEMKLVSFHSLQFLLLISCYLHTMAQQTHQMQHIFPTLIRLHECA